MRKIGGVKMGVLKKYSSNKIYSAYKSFENSLKEVNLHREGKIHLDTWDEYLKKKYKEQ